VEDVTIRLFPAAATELCAFPSSFGLCASGAYLRALCSPRTLMAVHSA